MCVRIFCLDTPTGGITRSNPTEKNRIEKGRFLAHGQFRDQPLAHCDSGAGGWWVPCRSWPWCLKRAPGPLMRLNN